MIVGGKKRPRVPLCGQAPVLNLVRKISAFIDLCGVCIYGRKFSMKSYRSPKGMSQNYRRTVPRRRSSKASALYDISTESSPCAKTSQSSMHCGSAAPTDATIGMIFLTRTRPLPFGTETPAVSGGQGFVLALREDIEPLAPGC